MRFQEIAVEPPEQLGNAVVAELLRLGQGQYLDEESRKLHDAVMRAPGMAIARADCEADAAIEIRRRVEIAHGMNDMVETAGHDDPSKK